MDTSITSRYWHTAQRSKLQQFFLVLLATTTLIVCSKITIPLQPVPVTLQTFGVLLIGFGLSRRLATYSVLSYLALGLLGVPVFAGVVAGPAILTGPTAGYLLGFLPAVMIAGYLSERGWGRHYLSTAAAAVLASACIFICGLSWLASFVGTQQAFQLGLLPFVWPAIAKLIAVTLMVPSLRR